MDVAIEIRREFPDRFGIKDAIRSGMTKSPEFLDLTLRVYKLLAHLKDQDLTISDDIKSNENLNVFDHQILAAQKVKNDLGGSAILADEVGLGKTVEAGIIIKEFLVTGLAKRVLILAPPSLLSQWKDEMYSKFDLSFTNHQDDPVFENAKSNDLLLMSHSSAVFPKQSAYLNSIYWDLVVVDEAHSMKNSSTYKHNLVKNLQKRNILLLTATPLQNNLEDLYNLVDLIAPGDLGSLGQFLKKYAADAKSRSINPLFCEELQRILSSLIIRTTRAEVRQYIKFTDRIPNTDIIDPADAESSLYNAITTVIRSLYMSNKDPLALMIYQRLASSSTEASKRALYKMRSNKMITDQRYDEIMAIANSIGLDSKLSKLLTITKNDKSKFLVFTEFYATQDYVAANLKKHGHSVTLFNGKMSSDEKQDSIRRFKGDTQIMISTSAGGEGQNFQFCHNVVNYDLPWNPMRVEQRIGRVHRIGQKNDVNIFNFALYGTIESYILELLYMKIDLFTMALGDMDLMFEDAWSGGSAHTWFKEYLNASDDEEKHNRFSALGEDWKSRKNKMGDVIQDFNSNVFTNFDLSVLKDKRP